MPPGVIHEIAALYIWRFLDYHLEQMRHKPRSEAWPWLYPLVFTHNMGWCRVVSSLVLGRKEDIPVMDRSSCKREMAVEASPEESERDQSLSSGFGRCGRSLTSSVNTSGRL